MSQQPSNNEETIVCRVTSWYYRRLGILSAMFLVFGLYFCYDGQYGYPAENKVADQKVWFEQTVQKGYDAAKDHGDAALKKWMEDAKGRHWVADLESPPRWDVYAAEHNWSSEPKKHSADAIEQQFYWGGAMILAAVWCAVLILLNRNKTFTGHADHMVMPDGKQVRFADVFKVDKRKWDNKALAYVHYRLTEGGAVQRAVVDDLKFDGAGRVLDRLLSLFSGELIEKLPDEAPAPEAGKKDDD